MNARFHRGTQSTHLDLGRHSYSDTTIGHITEDNGIRTNGNIIANANTSEQLCPSTNVDAVADAGGAAMVSIAQPHRDAIANDAIVTEDGITTDDNAPNMLDDKPVADDCLAWEFDAE